MSFKTFTSRILLFAILVCTTGTQAALGREKADSAAHAKTYKYRIYFTDKKNNTYTLREPRQFLSEKALERRRKFGLRLDEHDLPVTPVYLQYLNDRGLKTVATSKWNNTAVVEISDTTLLEKLKNTRFVKGMRRVWESPQKNTYIYPASRTEFKKDKKDSLASYYGHGETQVKMLGADSLHTAGFCGQGMLIAIIDGGFYNADCTPGLSHIRPVVTHNFPHPDRSVYDERQPHGTMVTSCIAAGLPHHLVGTAPEASLMYLVSEDGESEQMVEEDYWAAAIEFADSAGADIVTGSLSYNLFDDPTTSHTYSELDGKTTVCSVAASLAASRGIIVFASAGNSGDEEWKKIGVPGDADNILTIGAVNHEGTNTAFSSVGNTADNRIKPDVMAMGQNVYVLANQTQTADGTSFSTPLLCGGVACLWQAFSNKRPEEIMEAVRQSGNNAAHPDNIYGYGIPNLMKAFRILEHGH